MKKGEWRTKDGTILKIRGMTSEHIRNCMRMIHRACLDADLEAMAATTMFSEDSMASYYAQRECDLELATPIEQRFPKYGELICELVRRGVGIKIGELESEKWRI